MTWEEIAKNKKQEVFGKIPLKWIIEVPSIESFPNANDYIESILTEKELEITNGTISSTLDKLSTGEMKALDVIEAFCHRVAILHQLCNCLSEIFFDEAFERAKELDDYFEENKKLRGKLHGIPISLKDQFNLPGIDSCLGFVANVGKPKTQEEMSLLAQDLYSEGCIFFVKTAVPTSLMSGDCYSNLHGSTLNAVNRYLSCGGSSGGEATVVAGKGSLIGFGTDIGGSIRNPSSFTGIYGLKPSSDRLSYTGLTNTLMDHPVISSSVGPMCKSVEDLEYVTKILIDHQPWENDAKVPPIPWKEVKLKDKLKIAVFIDKPNLKCQPSIRRSILELIEKLKDHEVEIIDDKFPVDYDKISQVSGKLYGVNGYNDIKAKLEESGEKVEFLEYMSLFSSLSLDDEWELNKLKREFQLKFYEFFKHYDCLVTPTFCETSYESGTYRFASLNSAFVNVLDFTAMTLPLGHAKETDVWPKDYVPEGEANEELFKRFNISRLKGAPVLVQVVGKRYDEERVIEIIKLLDKLNK